MRRIITTLTAALTLLGLLAAMTAPVAPAAFQPRTYFRYCNVKHLGFGMTFHVVAAYGGHVADRISYYIAGTRAARNSTIVFFQKGPSLFHPAGKQNIYSGLGESVFGDITNADSDGKWHPLDQRHLSTYPLPIGTFPRGNDRFWKVWFHYVVDIWPHGNGNGGCSFSFEVLGPSNAYFP
ncbi:MAG: hypothetical protein JO153_15880 [Solirubrobacterales bacterium]|nr:hypothetical protein [Solirubrobacterales bacterium]